MVSSKEQRQICDKGKKGFRMLEPEYGLGGTITTDKSAVLDDPPVSFVGWDQWSDRIESMIERYPWPTLLLALGLGYLLARRLR